MVDNRFLVAVKDVNYGKNQTSPEERRAYMLTLDATAAVEQRTYVPFDCAIANKLVPDKVRVMRRRNVVVRERSSHVLMNRPILVSEGRITRGK